MLTLVTHPSYDIPLPDGHRFPATKFSRLMVRLRQDGLLSGFATAMPEPAARNELARTQDAAYVDAIADGTLDRESLRVLGLNWSRVLADRSFSCCQRDPFNGAPGA